MLDFLRSQPGRDLSTDKSDIAADNRCDKANQGSQEQQEGYLTPAVYDKRIKQGTVLLAALFGAGLLCLWFMIKKAAPAAAMADPGRADAQIEAAIAQFTGVKTEFSTGMKDLIDKFYNSFTVQQVQVHQLQKNPFKHDKFFGLLPKASGAGTEQTDSGLGQEGANKSYLEMLARNMQLKSIMQTSYGNCCMIDEMILYEGDNIKGFQVGKISNFSVELYAEDMRFVLKLESD